MRGGVSPVNRDRGCARVAWKPSDKNVKVIIISGMSGSGYEGYVGRAQSMLRNCGVATICLNTNLFLGFNARACSICKRAAKTRGIKEVYQCTMCPEALDVDKLNTAIMRVSAELLESVDFAEGIGKAVVILEGSYTLVVQAYNKVAASAKWWFVSGDTMSCKRTYLRQRMRWVKPPRQSDDDYLSEVESRNNHRLWRAFYHEEFLSPKSEVFR